MSNFESLSLVTETLVGSAPSRFVGSTTDSYATMIAAGYLNDIAKKIKANDVFDINYADTSTFPLNVGEASLFASFVVQYDPTLGNWNLVPRSSVVPSINAYGVESNVVTGNSASATFTINDASINPNSVVIARFQASATSARIETVTPGNGTLAIKASAIPAAYTLEYISVLPSVALQSAGVVAAQASVTGASATVVISNPLITASSIVTVNCVSQTNASYVLTAIAAAGTLTLVFNTAPGASVISYLSVTPSSALTTLGMYAASYSNAGGSATTTISDANITASSVVVAGWASEGNTSSIYKVTPSAGTLTILSSADPGASVLNYTATPGAEQPSAYLPLAGGQMTGAAYLTKGTATFSTNAATLNTQAGILTTASLTTASGSSATAQVLTNSLVNANSVCVCSVVGGTNTTLGVSVSAVCTAGTITFTIFNNGIAAAALNGTVIIAYVVL